MKYVAWIGLGSNLDVPQAHIKQGFQDLAHTPEIDLLATSDLYQTTPVGGPEGQPDFCNACAAVATTLTPLKLLDKMQAIELAHGRVRDIIWGPRTLDLDMLAFGELVMDHPRLKLPHPLAVERGFVLKPLADISPVLTLNGRRVVDWLAEVDTSDIGPWPV